MPNPRDRGRRPSDQGRTARLLGSLACPSRDAESSHFCRIHRANHGAIHCGEGHALRCHYRVDRAPVLDLGRRLCPGRARLHVRAPHPMGGQEPLPPVPQRGRFPAPRCRASWRGRVGGRAPAGARQRRPRLGARHGRAAVRRPRRQAARILRSRRRARTLSGGPRPPHRRDLGGSSAGERGLRLELRRRRRPRPAINRRLQRRGQNPRAPRPHHGRERRHRAARWHRAADRERDPGARRADRRHGRLDRRRRGQSGPRGLAFPTKGSAFAASAASSITGPGAPASTATSLAAQCRATMPGSAIGRGKARAG